MPSVGIISGTIPLHEEEIFRYMKKTVVKTEFGNALIFVSEMAAFIPRHGVDADRSIPPHMINHPANLKALQDMGVKEVIGINSTGSLKRELKPGTIIIPDDYISTSVTPTIFHDNAIHTIPIIDEGIRKRLIQTSENLGINALKNGVYWQTAGPRLETKAEIRMISQFADIIGMTMASEAIIAAELELSYSGICSVDNYANGIVEKPLVPDEIRKGARKNARNMMEIVKKYVSEFSGSARGRLDNN